MASNKISFPISQDIELHVQQGRYGVFLKLQRTYNSKPEKKSLVRSINISLIAWRTLLKYSEELFNRLEKEPEIEHEQKFRLYKDQHLVISEFRGLTYYGISRLNSELNMDKNSKTINLTQVAYNGLVDKFDEINAAITDMTGGEWTPITSAQKKRKLSEDGDSTPERKRMRENTVAANVWTTGSDIIFFRELTQGKENVSSKTIQVIF